MKKFSLSVFSDNVYELFINHLSGQTKIIIYDELHKDSIIEKIEQVQYKACLVITGAFKGISRERYNYN